MHSNFIKKTLRAFHLVDIRTFVFHRPQVSIHSIPQKDSVLVKIHNKFNRTSYFLFSMHFLIEMQVFSEKRHSLLAYKQQKNMLQIVYSVLYDKNAYAMILRNSPDFNKYCGVVRNIQEDPWRPGECTDHIILLKYGRCLRVFPRNLTHNFLM